MTNAEKFFREFVHTSPNAQITSMKTLFNSNLYRSTNDEMIYMTNDTMCSFYNKIFKYKVEGNDSDKAITKLYESINTMDFNVFRPNRKNYRAIVITWGGIYVVYSPDEDSTIAYAVAQIGTLRYLDKWGNVHDDIIPNY